MQRLLLKLTRRLWNNRIVLTLADAWSDGLITDDQRDMLTERLVLRTGFAMYLCDRHGGNTLPRDICPAGNLAKE